MSKSPERAGAGIWRRGGCLVVRSLVVWSSCWTTLLDLRRIPMSFNKSSLSCSQQREQETTPKLNSGISAYVLAIRLQASKASLHVSTRKWTNADRPWSTPPLSFVFLSSSNLSTSSLKTLSTDDIKSIDTSLSPRCLPPPIGWRHGDEPSVESPL